MKQEYLDADAVIIGGGFYGSVIAAYLKKIRGMKKVMLLEKEKALLTRASYNNQARVHNGYHYPRCFTTAFRSRINLPKFLQDWPQAVFQDFVKLYALARQNSKITAKQFARFCHMIGAKVQPAGAAYARLFEPQLVEEVFLVEEFAFDTTKLSRWAVNELQEAGVEIHYSTRAISVNRTDEDGCFRIVTQNSHGHTSSITCRYIFNCTYSGLNHLKGDFSGTHTSLKHEITEMALVAMPDALKDVGITVMDGPFFSVMPFPSRGLHTLSHVRYTPHLSWQDTRQCDPYLKLEAYGRDSRAGRMIRDAARYLPAVLQAKYVDSLFEVKTVLVKNEGNDGRPILFEKHPELPGVYSILGGKIDNIYDIIEKLESEKFYV